MVKKSCPDSCITLSTNRLGYPHDTNLLFEIDLEKEDKILTVKLLPEEIAQSPAPSVDK